MQDYDVAVLGLGAMGSAALSALARRGARVVGIERFDVPHGEGSSGGQSRLIRTAYYEHPDYVPLLQRAFAGWRALEKRSGARILFETGLIEMGRTDGPLVTGVLRAAAEHGLAVERVARDACRARFPALTVPTGHEVLFESAAGFVLCERAIAAFVDEARRHGAAVHAREQVLQLARDGDRFVIATAGTRWRCARVVLCAGAWTAPLVQDLGIPLRVTRQPLCWFAPHTRDTFTLDRFPCFAIEDDQGGGGLLYGFPELPIAVADGPRGLKAAVHRLGETTAPDAVDRSLRPDDESAVRDALRRYLKDADGPLCAAKVCLYTNSPDGHFIVDRHPRERDLVLACGFSGHGFKFAPVLGEALADLALDGATALRIGFLGTGRFA
ncbi:MAG: N-methyl-L-tryptophan oxidase [Planctomycetota bacterium]